MNVSKTIKILILCVLLSGNFALGQNQERIIYLSWEQVVRISLKDNLSLRSKMLEYESQNLETWKSLSYFLPTLSYQGIAQKNVELPVFVFMGQQFAVGTPYNFQHSLVLTSAAFNRRQQMAELRCSEKHKEISQGRA